MNTETGQIVHLPSDQDALLSSLIPIDFALATERQKAEMQVSLKDRKSDLGKLLTASRSKYVPHVGKKEQEKLAALRS